MITNITVCCWWCTL